MDAADIAVEIGDHVVQFYERDVDLTGAVARYVIRAQQADEVAVVVATPQHRDALRQELRAAGIDLGAASHRGVLVMLDAASIMGEFVQHGVVDPAGFKTVVGGVLRQAATHGRPIRAYGEMVALLWERGEVSAAIELEALWNELGGEVPFSLFCAYPTDAVLGSGHADALREVCHLHSALVQAVATRSFPQRLHAPRAARRFVVDTLQRWGFDSLIDDAAVIASELATNAVLHARSEFTVSERLDHDLVHVSVEDSSDSPPKVRPRDNLATSGRGITLTAGLAVSWGTENTAAGKVVWAELRR